MVPMTAIRLQRATNAPLAVDVVLSAQTSSIENIAELGVARLSCSEDGCRLRTWALSIHVIDLQ